jgi:hypothetical protein
VFESAKPVTCIALFDLGFEGDVVREDYGGEEQWVEDLRGAGFEVFDAFDDVGGGGAFAEAGGESGVYGVREGEFPAAGVAFFADVGFAVDDF